MQHSQRLSRALTVISAIIACLTASKASILLDMCKEGKCHCLCLQEKHRGLKKPMRNIADMALNVFTNIVALFS